MVHRIVRSKAWVVRSGPPFVCRQDSHTLSSYGLKDGDFVHAAISEEVRIRPHKINSTWTVGSARSTLLYQHAIDHELGESWGARDRQLPPPSDDVAIDMNRRGDEHDQVRGFDRL